MSAQHTPGPWVFENRNGDHPLNNQNGWGCDGLWAVNGGLILGAGPGWDGEYVAPDDANANLIAAAPDLLEALKKSRRELHACQAVIHLAGGFDPAYVRDAQAALKVMDAAIAKATGENA